MKRIDRIISLLEIYWKRHPKMTLGKIIALGDSDTQCYFISDSIYEEYLENLTKPE